LSPPIPTIGYSLILSYFSAICHLTLPLPHTHTQHNHFDVMQEFDPFSLSIDGDKLRGRGTTDCLGHVALLTELMKKLGQTKPKLKSTVVAVFIANEENSSITGIGVDELVKDGLLQKLKDGPL